MQHVKLEMPKDFILTDPKKASMELVENNSNGGKIEFLLDENLIKVNHRDHELVAKLAHKVMKIAARD
jgi:hypothetical protein